MSCPTCDHTMHALGCKVTEKNFFYCPRCGTILPCQEAEPIVPGLIEWIHALVGRANDPALNTILRVYGILKAVGIK